VLSRAYFDYGIGDSWYYFEEHLSVSLIPPIWIQNPKRLPCTPMIMPVVGASRKLCMRNPATLVSRIPLLLS